MRVGTKTNNNGCFTVAMMNTVVKPVMRNPNMWISQSEQFLAGKFSQKLS